MINTLILQKFYPLPPHFLYPAELSRTNIPNVKNILSNLDSSDKFGDKPRDNNLNTLENSAKYNQGRGQDVHWLQATNRMIANSCWLLIS